MGVPVRGLASHLGERSHHHRRSSVPFEDSGWCPCPRDFQGIVLPAALREIEGALGPLTFLWAPEVGAGVPL